MKAMEFEPGVVLLVGELCRCYQCGLRPLRAVGSMPQLVSPTGWKPEPEAIGAYAHAPAGRQKIEAKENKEQANETGMGSIYIPNHIRTRIYTD